MPKIFICYRRDDSADVTGRIDDHIERHFDRENVFIDVDVIPAGVDFRRDLQDAVIACDVVLVVIGPDWLADQAGNRRLDDPHDFVRIEIEAALQRDIRIIPVLVRNAIMPGPTDLPAGIQDLSFRNAVQVRSGRDFRADIRRLIRELEAVTSQAEAVRPALAQTEARSPEAPAPVPQRPFPPASRAPIEPPTVSPPGEAAQADEVITNSIGMKIVLIPAGEFMMGSPESDPNAGDDEKPRHVVRIKRPFYLGIYPLTQEQYERVMGTNPSHFVGDPNRPVEMVSWNDAQEFSRRVSALTDEQAAAHVYRLPTEAEWEYACRAGSTTRYSFGDSTEKLGDYAWWGPNSHQTTHPVGEKKPNACGLHDMHGNVWEWCTDSYGTDYCSQSPPSHLNGPSSGASRVLRGGSCLDGNPVAFRCAYRACSPPEYRARSYGFRVARTLTP